jgi:hypothetical protein
MLAAVVEVYPDCFNYFLFAFLAVIPAIIGGDIAMHKVGRRAGVIIAGALIGVIFYIFNFPMLPMAFAELQSQPNASFVDIVPSMYATLSQVIVMATAPSMLAGIVGAIIGAKKIEIPSQVEAAVPKTREMQ